MHFEILSEICFSVDQSKILSSVHEWANQSEISLFPTFFAVIRTNFGHIGHKSKIFLFDGGLNILVKQLLFFICKCICIRKNCGN